MVWRDESYADRGICSMSDLRAAATAFNEGRLEEAESLCRAVLANAPRNAEARLLLTALLLGRDRLAEAEACTAEAMTDHAGHPEWLNLRGVALARLGRREEAIACFDRAIERRLLFPTAHANLLLLLAECRDPTPRFKVTLITPTVGSAYLAQAIESVQRRRIPWWSTSSSPMVSTATSACGLACPANRAIPCICWRCRSTSAAAAIAVIAAMPPCRSSSPGATSASSTRTTGWRPITSRR
jgi:tetratricopeptide (TPR) repeat protein